MATRRRCRLTHRTPFPTAAPPLAGAILHGCRDHVAGSTRREITRVPRASSAALTVHGSTGYSWTRASDMVAASMLFGSGAGDARVAEVVPRAPHAALRRD